MTKSIDIALADEAGSFYVSERKVYPRDVHGRFDRLRTAAVIWLLGMFYAFPWLRWDGRRLVTVRTTIRMNEPPQPPH